MANTPRMTIVLPDALRRHYEADAASDYITVSESIRRALFRDSGVSRDPEETSKMKTPELPLS